MNSNFDNDCNDNHNVNNHKTNDDNMNDKGGRSRREGRSSWGWGWNQLTYIGLML